MKIFEKIEWEWQCVCDICNNKSWCSMVKKHIWTWKILCSCCVYHFSKKEEK